LIYLSLVFGFVLLIVGAGWLIDGALKLARRFGASDLAVGLTVVSIGTSVPELVVNVAASLRGSPDLAIGNILGSNIANVLLILGAAGAFRALPIRDRTILSEIPICLAATLLVGFLANAHLFTAGRSDAGVVRARRAIRLLGRRHGAADSRRGARIGGWRGVGREGSPGDRRERGRE